MSEILILFKSFVPYLPQTAAVLLIGGLFLFKALSREKEIILKIDKLSQGIEKIHDELKEEIKEIRKDLNHEKEKSHKLELKLAEKYLSVDRWLEINNKFEASVKQELSRIHRSLESLNKILIEVLKDGRKAG